MEKEKRKRGRGKTGGRRGKEENSLIQKKIKKEETSEAISLQPYGINDKEQALLLMKISCQSTGPCRK